MVWNLKVINEFRNNSKITFHFRFTFWLDLSQRLWNYIFQFRKKNSCRNWKVFHFWKKSVYSSAVRTVCVYVIKDKLVKLLALLNRQHSWFRFQAPWHSSSKNQTFLVFNLKYSCGLTICVVVKRANFVILGLSQKDANLIKAAIN